MHLIGLVSDGGVHSSDRHLKALIELAAERASRDLVVHAFTDGRDTSPHGRRDVPRRRSRAGARAGAGRIGSVIGRYFAMDRDKRWDRIAEGRTTCSCTARPSTTPTPPSEAAERRLRARRDGRVHHRRRRSATRRAIRAGDAVLGFNFRPDRMREITRALADRLRRDRPRRRRARRALRDAGRVRGGLGLSRSSSRPSGPAITIGAGDRRRGACGQLHVAETEKYPHVTYFFNGGEEHPYEGEVRELVPSPRDVPTYDHKPEMSAREATDAFVRALRGRASRRSRSSTSPTRTWSATRA